ncbi:nuclear transport factor 2 family protein [Hyalangium sp.]|uniref:nuclear transport factor 2 family protein n=1 Tax=Hyalangium sp. TaxID=2028555 RepID=UPI002D78CA52|nr:nuclear transport factor 2 family protein [Hyalangium sp.]
MTDKSAESRAVVLRTLDAFGRVDLQALYSTFKDDVVWDVIGGSYLPQGGHYVGKEAVIQTFLVGFVTACFDFTAPFKFEIKSVSADGPTVVVEWFMSAKTVRGLSYENNYCVVFTVTHGQVQSVREYTDTAYQLRVLFE